MRFPRISFSLVVPSVAGARGLASGGVGTAAAAGAAAAEIPPTNAAPAGGDWSFHAIWTTPCRVSTLRVLPIVASFILGLCSPYRETGRDEDEELGEGGERRSCGTGDGL